MQQAIKFKSHGLEIAGVLHLPNKEGVFPAVVFAHGYMSGKDGRKAQYLGEWAQKNNTVFLRFDFSGVGESEGAKERITITNYVEELKSAISLLEKHAQVSDKIIVIGSSFGGLISLLEASKDKRVTGLIEIAPLTRLIRDEMVDVNKKYGINMLQDFYMDLSTYRVFPMLEKIKVPVTIFHGELDDVVAISQSKRAVRHLSHALLVPLPDADHYFKDEAVFTDLMKRVTVKINELSQREPQQNIVEGISTMNRSKDPFSEREMEKVSLKLTCEECGKEFDYSYSYPKGTMDPCMQGQLPTKCEKCDPNVKDLF